jgi:hypothetical protein
MDEVPAVEKLLVGSADIDQRLIALRAHGFRFGTNRDVAGMVVALVAARTHHGVIDIVQIYGEQDADATRISVREPEILFPRAIFWHTNGSANHVIDALLSLADPVTELSDRPRSARRISSASIVPNIRIR